MTATGEVGSGAFGTSVAISQNGHTALVGAPNDDGGLGAAFVFVRSGSGWSQVAELLPDDESGAGKFGSSVALSSDGTTALIGGDEDNGGHGAAWVFVNSGAGWAQQGPKLVPSDETYVTPSEPLSPSSVPGFGESVALSDDGATALIGDPTDTCVSCGAVWAFTRSGTTWSQGGGKIIPNNQRIDSAYYGEAFGKAVALSGNGQIALVGDPDNGYGAGGGTGGLYVAPGGAWAFDRVGSTFVQAATIGVAADWPTATCDFPCPSGSALGSSVALSADGQTALIGGAGAAEVLSGSGSQWTEDQVLTPAGLPSSAGDVVATLSADGQTALLGTGTINSLSGTIGTPATPVWAFARSGSSWSQYGGALSPSGPSGQTESGSSVAISGDGSTALIGGPEDSTLGSGSIPSGDMGLVSGAVWTFTDEYPTVSGVSPAAGSAVGGTVVKIAGTGFTGATGVSFGGVPASSFTLVSDGEIDATSPAGAAGTVDVTVAGPEGVSPASSADDFTYQGTPSVPGAPTSPATLSSPTVPAAPTAITAVAGDQQATVSFHAPADNGSPITSYTVTTSPGNAHVTASSAPITVRGLRNGTRYTFKVTATNAVGVGPASASSGAVIPSAGAAVSRFRLAGLGADRPTLRFSIAAGTEARAIRSVKITLPRGLRLAPGQTRKIRVSPGGHSIKMHGSTVTLAPTGNRTRLTVELERGALVETTGMRHTIKRLNAYNRVKVHHVKRRLTVRIALGLRTQPGGPTRLTLRKTMAP